MSNLAQSVKVLPHSPEHELFSHVFSSFSISLLLYKHVIEVKEAIKCFSEVPFVHSQDDLLLGLLLFGLLVADVFPAANGLIKFSVEQSSKHLVSHRTLLGH